MLNCTYVQSGSGHCCASLCAGRYSGETSPGSLSWCGPLTSATVAVSIKRAARTCCIWDWLACVCVHVSVCICVCTCMCTCTCVCMLQSCATLHTIRTNPCLFVPYCLASLLKRLDWYRKTLTCRTRTDHNRSDYKQLAWSTNIRRYYSFDPVDYRLLVLRPSDSPLRHVVMCQFMPLTHLAVRSSRWRIPGTVCTSALLDFRVTTAM